MKVTEEEIGRALKLAFSEHWENGLPRVPAKLRLVINSLINQTGGKLPRDPRRLCLLIQGKKNKKIRKILRQEDITTESLGFAVRDALS